MKTDANGRPMYPVTAAELDAQLDASNAALAERLALIEKQNAAELARFPAAPAPRSAKASK